MYVIILMRAYATGVGHSRVSTTFLSQKNSQIVLVLLTGFELQVFGS